MWIDSHNHLHDPRLPALDAEGIADLRALGIERAVVNGTCEADWPLVSALAKKFPDFVIPCFGLHPWHIADRSPSWLEILATFLQEHPGCPVGEIGLDRWVSGHDVGAQREVLLEQAELASNLDRPITIHCLKAWEDLAGLWPELPRRPGRCLLHGFTGGSELAGVWIKNGCLLGFGGHALHPSKTAAREAFTRMAVENILIETDAPDMAAPEELRTHHLPDRKVHHPGNLRRYAEILAGWRGLTPDCLAASLAKNSRNWLGA